jgi:hypothetical protein
MSRRIVVLIPLIILLVGSVGCDFKLPEKEPVPITETREVSPFQEIMLSGEGELEILQGDTVSLNIEAEQLDMPKISTNVVNNRLIIRTDMLRSPIPIIFQVTVTDVNKISLTGPGHIYMHKLETDNLFIDARGVGMASLALGNLDIADYLILDMRGTADVTVSDLAVPELTAKLRGSGVLEIAGEVERQNITIFDTSIYQASELQSKRASVEVSGAGDATLRVQETLDIGLSGSGNVYYYGEPAVEQDVTGSGTVEHLEDE